MVETRSKSYKDFVFKYFTSTSKQVGHFPNFFDIDFKNLFMFKIVYFLKLFKCISISLHGIDLYGNPWNCTCGMRPIRQWLLENNVPSSIPPPMCTTPSRYYYWGHKISKLTVSNSYMMFLLSIFVTYGMSSQNAFPCI